MQMGKNWELLPHLHARWRSFKQCCAASLVLCDCMIIMWSDLFTGGKDITWLVSNARESWSLIFTFYLIKDLSICNTNSNFITLILLILILVLKSVFYFGEIKVFPCASLENIQDILQHKPIVIQDPIVFTYQASSFKVWGGIIRLRNEDLVGCSVIHRGKDIAYLQDVNTEANLSH